MKKIIIFALLILSTVCFGQTVTGSSIAFSTNTTNKCDDPILGKTVLCATPTAVTVSFNGAAPITLPAQGIAGAAATITIGTTTQGAAGTAAKVTNSGTANAVVLNFTIPAGAPGSNGKDGATGAAGAQGPQGVAGSTGPTGAQGPKGDQGPQGVPGPSGGFALVNASCGLVFTGQTNSDGSIGVKINCQ